MDALLNVSRTINVDMSSMSGIREGIAAAVKFPTICTAHDDRQHNLYPTAGNVLTVLLSILFSFLF
jgi:hypothetical protein